jgi:hypothetical protein
LASPGRIRIHDKKAAKFLRLDGCPCADTPEDAPLDEWLLLDTPTFSWKPTITERTLLSGFLALRLDSSIAKPGE